MMSTWLHNLPIWLMTLVAFGATFLAGAALHVITAMLAGGQHGRSYGAISPALLSPIGIIFGLFIAFTAAQVWNDTARATAAVNTEAGALRSIVVMSAVLPQESQVELRKLVRDYIQYTADDRMAADGEGESLRSTSVPPSLNKAIQSALSLAVDTPGQQTAQAGGGGILATGTRSRRERILISRTQVNGVKWACLIFLGVCLLFAIALVHCENRLASAVAIGLFSAVFATTILLILAHDRPLPGGEIALTPEPLLQVIPAER
ncbi:DUF4239 domain-containing protein [Paraburkholderia dipogonis]|uniref:bestrophin-like domain n=1 Tax=Paraburkholderia dipogonis TaxID=1211383 RepID=UPI0035EF6759